MNNTHEKRDLNYTRDRNMISIWDLILAENIENPRAQVGHVCWVMGLARFPPACPFAILPCK